ncbi:site-specific integrase [Paraflavisolibacter sp. H34]|uniref:tyrosine-type recombinase/integrase n=1 Tax=Huijunlia imazamoxiresistens TaxID=3127457 RepID=UPI0030182AA3
MNELEAAKVHAQELVKQVKPFTFAGFEKRMQYRPILGDFFKYSCEKYIDELKKQGRMGNAASHQTAMNSMLKFKPKIIFEEITPDFLRAYEHWMIQRGRSRTTVGIYLRQIRTIFNEAIAEGLISRDIYPFGKRKYVVPTGRNVKKALTLAEIGKIYYYEAEPGTSEEMARDLWMFSYFANGINFKDLALLRYRNIQDEYIIFERAKTIFTSRANPRPISVYINSDMERIINRWGNKPIVRDSFIFPIIDPGADVVRQDRNIEQIVQFTNRNMKRIGEKLGIEKTLTTYAARHSFSTVLKRSGASIEFISECLGHSNVRTTENYLDSFENEMKKHFSKSLLAFKEVPMRVV